MSSSPPTVPPPAPDDHEDVAWALRAAAAQWRRDAHTDAIAWVERAAETAEEVGHISRSVALIQLAESLRRSSRVAPASFAPPPPASSPAGAVAPPAVVAAAAPPLPPLAPSIPPTPRAQAALAPPPLVSPLAPLDGRPALPSVTVEVDVDLDDDVEFLDDVEELEAFDEDEPVVVSSEAFSAPSHAQDSVADAPSVEDVDTGDIEFGELDEREEDPPALEDDGVPASGAIGEELRWGEPASERSPSSSPQAASVEFGELDFVDEAPTSPGDIPPRGITPPTRSSGTFDLDLSTPAEVAMSRRSDDLVNDTEDIERELGVDLSLDVSRPSRPQPVAPLPPLPELERPGTIGMARVSPSRPAAPQFGPRIPEPFLEAPSAQLPPTAPVEPPSRPSQAPPPDRMLEPEPEGFSPSSLLFDDEEPPGALRPGAVHADAGRSKEAEPRPPSSRSSARPPASRPFATLEAPRSSRFPSRSAPPPSEPPPPSVLDHVDLLDVPGLQDLPEEAQTALATGARIVRLERGEEVSSFGAALVTHGAVQLMPTIADAACALVRKGEVIFTRGTLDTGVELRVVGFDPGSRVAVFGREEFQAATADFPWVADELALVADKYQALAGAVMGPLGDSLDDIFRGMVLDKCTVKRPRPGDGVATAGKPVDGLYIVGAGSLEVLEPDGSVSGELFAGDFVFPETLLAGGAAPRSVRVGSGGALLLYASRMAAHELLATCPPFIELLAG